MLTASAIAEAARSTQYAKLDQFAKLGTAAKNNSLMGVGSQSASTTRSRMHLKAVKPSPSPKITTASKKRDLAPESTVWGLPDAIQNPTSTHAQPATKTAAVATLRLAQK